MLDILLLAEQHLIAIGDDALAVAKLAPAYDIAENFP